MVPNKTRVCRLSLHARDYDRWLDRGRGRNGCRSRSATSLRIRRDGDLRSESEGSAWQGPMHCCSLPSVSASRWAGSPNIRRVQPLFRAHDDFVYPYSILLAERLHRLALPKVMPDHLAPAKVVQGLTRAILRFLFPLIPRRRSHAPLLSRCCRPPCSRPASPPHADSISEMFTANTSNASAKYRIKLNQTVRPFIGSTK